MNEPVTTQKKSLRQELRRRLAAIPELDRQERSLRACSILQAQALWISARSIFFYSPMPSELDTSSLLPEALESKKVVLFPKFDPRAEQYLPYRIQGLDDLTTGKFGILEPRENCCPYSVKQLDLTLVPALGFDLFGRRLGRGRGFYDKLLVEVSGTKCGVAFDEQLVHQVPVEPHDLPVGCLLTPTRWIVVSGAKFE